MEATKEEIMKHKPGTALPQDSYSPSEAVALARDDHRAQSLIDWPFLDALRKAEERCNAYPRLVANLKSASANLWEAMGGSDDAENRERANSVCAPFEALLRELGELS